MVLYTTGLAVTCLLLLFALLVTMIRCSKRKIDIAVLEKSRLELSKKIEWLEAELDRVTIERHESTSIFLAKIENLAKEIKNMKVQEKPNSTRTGNKSKRRYLK